MLWSANAIWVSASALKISDGIISRFPGAVDDILRNLEPHGEDKVAKFKSWVDMFQ